MDYLLSLFAPAALGTGGLSEENFASRVSKSFDYIPDSTTLVVCLPGWGQRAGRLARLRSYVRASDASLLTYEFPRAVLSDDKALTRALFQLINRTVRDEIAALKQSRGFARCVLIGVSLGCAMSAMVYKDNADIDETVLVVPGENVARDLWHGCRTRHLKRSYVRQGVTRDELEKLWHDLAPEHNFPSPRTQVRLFYGRYDKVIPFVLSRTLHESLVREGRHATMKVLSLGHYAVATYFLLFPGRFLGMRGASKVSGKV